MIKSKIYKKLPQIFVVFNGIVCIFACGIEFAWLSPFIPELLSEDFPIEVTLEDVSLATTMGLIGLVVGCTLCTLFIDRIGRKYTLLLLAPVLVVTFLLLYFSAKSLIFLHIGLFLGGIIQPQIFLIFPIYISEISEPDIRGILICLVSVVFYAGAIFVNIIGAYYGLQTTCLIIAVFPLIFLITFSFAPKSPYYLLMNNNVEEARHSLKKLRYNKDVEVELAQLKEDVKKEIAEHGTWRDLFLVKSNRNAFLIICTLNFFEIFSGHGTLIILAQTFFADAVTVIPTEWAASLMLLIEIVFVFVTIFLVDSIGRKPLLLISLAGTFTTLFLLALYFLIKDFFWPDITYYSWISLLVLILYNAFFNVGLAEITPCIRAELLPLKVKAVGNSAASALLGVCVFASTKLYQSLADYYSIAWPLLIFAVIEVGGFVFCWFCLPETKGKTLGEIQQELKQSD